MRRADRLFHLIQLLRGRRRAVTARWLAEQLSVSERTVYRDVRDLIASGTPIEGEAGVGYRIRNEYDLPPLMFDEEEVAALVLGARIVAAVGDDELGRAANALLSKVESVLPERLKSKLNEAALYAPRRWTGRSASEPLVKTRAALASRRKLALHYERVDGERTERTVRPLGAFFWGTSWTLTAWCELRNDFRNFRLDRVQGIEVTDDAFEDEPGKTLRDYLRTIGPFAERLLDE